ncbi:MAG TPA: hypothetical protein VK453_14745 [Micromonosporaceae bacterium]|nr:hypothetical protein [Micromonosporaceae bacterium]
MEIVARIALPEALRLVGWGPRQLAVAVNSRLSEQGRERYRIDPTTAYSWVGRGYCPRQPIPAVVAAVLSEQLCVPVRPSDLWPGRADAVPVQRGAADGLDGISRVDDILGELTALVAGGAAPHGGLDGASGADLNAAVVDQLRGAAFVARNRVDRERVLPQQVELIANHVAGLRRLDDRHGGGSLSMRYVTSELRSVVDLVESASYERGIGRRLLTIVADLAQLLGWMQFDSGRYGAAERYLLLSLGVSRSFGEHDRAANVIGMLTYVSAFAGHGAEALRLAEAGPRECPRPDPILRARLLGRDATAAAADGDLGRFRRSSEGAMELLTQHWRREVPTFLYYLEPDQLAAETGQGLVVLAERTTASRKRLLTEAIAILGPISAPGQRLDYPRSALLHTTFLAKAYLLRGDLPAAVEAMRGALDRLAEVQSPRGRTYLRALRPALARRARSPIVAEFLPHFDQALSNV